MNANVYQHFRKDEHPFIDLMYDRLEQVRSQYAPYVTNFLDPREAYILENLARQSSEINLLFFGGYEQAERKRCLIYPAYYQPSQEDFELDLFEIIYPTKFALLSHGEILGTLVNSGIKREFFGDILSDGLRWQFFVTKNMGKFLPFQIEKIGKVSVRLENRKYTEIILPKDEWIQNTVVISSVRLDNLISTVYNMSRQKSKQLIESSKVKVNWVVTLRPDFFVDVLDVVSVRGFGRIKIQKLEGNKKKFRAAIEALRK